MHPIDEAVIDGTLTEAMLREHAARPLPKFGDSHWGDAMRVCDGNVLLAANLAALRYNREFSFARRAVA